MSLFITCISKFASAMHHPYAYARGKVAYRVLLWDKNAAKRRVLTMYASIGTYSILIRLCRFVQTTHTCVYVYMCVCTCTYVYIHTHTCMCVCMYIHTLHTHIHTHTCMYIHTHMCIAHSFLRRHTTLFREVDEPIAHSNSLIYQYEVSVHTLEVCCMCTFILVCVSTCCV